jgi:mitochondrial fission protein ELM1
MLKGCNKYFGPHFPKKICLGKKTLECVFQIFSKFELEKIRKNSTKLVKINANHIPLNHFDLVVFKDILASTKVVVPLSKLNFKVSMNIKINIKYLNSNKSNFLF